MFRTIGRIACIVLVAGAVGGTLFLLVDRSGGAAETGRRADGGRRHHDGWPGRAERVVAGERESSGQVSRIEQREDDGRGETRNMGQGGGRGQVPQMGHGGREGHGEFSFGRGIGGVGVTLIQVGLVAAVVAGVQKRLRRQAAARQGTTS